MKHLALLLIVTMSVFKFSCVWAAKADRTENYLKSKSINLQTPADLDALMDRIGDSRVVLLGESSHGTSQYYQWRAEISKRLIAEKGFDFIVVEGDWPSCYQVNRYIKNMPEAPKSAYEALAAFQRWPRWMWANQEIASLVEWLRKHNDNLPENARAGFFGFDVYSLEESIDSVLGYARQNAPDLIDDLDQAYSCLRPFRNDLHRYARYTGSGQNCAGNVQRALSLLKENAERLSKQDRDAFFYAKQNAYVVKRAEMHYRAMAEPRLNSWNKRAEHMKATLTRLLDHHGPDSKAIVWAHNTHIGDARATDMAGSGMKNIGWLARETYGQDNVVAVGFTTHRGKVLAGRQWAAPMETMTVPPAMKGSIEDIFNRLELESLMVIFDDDVPQELQKHIGHRAKGVVYNPANEMRNYVPTVLPRRYDAFIFIAETSELNALSDDHGSP